MSTYAELEEGSPKTIRTWLFNPFRYVAGWQALAVGLVLILVAGFIGSLTTSHFDGVLDFHVGTAAPLWVFLAEGLIDWVVMGVLLLFAGLIISKSRVRPLDVFATQALARAPGVVTVLLALLPGFQRFNEYLIAKYLQRQSGIDVVLGDLAVFALVVLVAIVMTIWMVALMYRAFAVACNVAGAKAVVAFIVALILGEVISKTVIMAAILAVAS